MKKVTAMLITVILFALLVQPLAAQDSGLLTVERIFASPEFRGEYFGGARWLEDGRGYTYLKRSAEVRMGRNLVLVEPASGEETVLVSAKDLIPAGSDRPVSISNYSWSPEGERLLIFTNTKRVWRINTKGDYWVYDLKKKSLYQLGKDAEPSTLMFATFSPDGKYVAYVMKHNIYVEDPATGAITQLTSDGSETLINGTFDWVYEEEFSLRHGFRWSPDSKYIAFWQLDAEGVGEYYMLNTTDSIYSKIVPVQYPKVGTTNSSCRVGVISAKGGEITWMKTPGDKRNTYIARMEWAANSDEVLMQHMNRLQNTNTLFLGSRKTGEVKTAIVEKDDAWVDINDDLMWLYGGKKFTWVSERDGWRHMYIISRDGKNVKLITGGDYDVISILKIDDRGGWIYFIASPENPTQRYLYRVRLTGGKPEMLTPADQPGGHRYMISQDSRWAFHYYSRFGVPGIAELVSLPDHKTVRVLAANEELRKKIAALKRGPFEFFRVKADNGVEIDGYCMKPYDFDPSREYPVLFHVYGEPAAQTVMDRWGGAQFLWHTMLTQKGYIVMSLDNRGTPAPRGRSWRKSIYKKIGAIPSEDQAAGLRALLKERPYMDKDRIGIWGWSGGGSMTLNMMFRYPELYKTGMSVAPVTNQRLYDTIYQERYMGLPNDDPEAYKNGSPVTFAKNLQGNLLIVHGTGDDNVHYQNTEVVINELVRYNKSFTMMAYPNRTHGIYEGRGTTLHLYNLLTRYLLTNLKPGPESR